MTSNGQMVERRKHKRFRVPKGIFTFLKPGYSKIGSVIDISSGGLAFRYIDGEEPSSGTNMDIFMFGDFFHMDNVPVRTISDIELVHGRPYVAVTVRRCGVQFGELTDRQKMQLEQCIEKYAIREE